jgi:hypothetical protein
MTGGPGFQVAIGQALSHLFRRIEIWTAPVPEPVLGLALLTLAAVFAIAALHGRRPAATDEAQAAADGEQPAVTAGGISSEGTNSSPAPVPDHHCHPPVRTQP